MSVTFTAQTSDDWTMMATWGTAEWTDVTDADGELIDIDQAVLKANIYDDSEALATYEDAQIEADDAWTQPDYTDGYAIAVETTLTADSAQINDFGICVMGTTPTTTVDGADVAGDAFTSCVIYNSTDTAMYSYTTEALAVDDEDPTALYTGVTEADNIGYNASWVSDYEVTSAQYLTDASLEQIVMTSARFLPQLTDGAYSSTDVRFDADTVSGKFCLYEYSQFAEDNGDAAAFSCVATTDADGAAFWAGATTVAAGAVVAIAATLF